MASVSPNSQQQGAAFRVDLETSKDLRRGTPVVSVHSNPVITKTEAASCSDLSKLQPQPSFQRRHARASSTSPSLTVRFRKKRTKKQTDARPQSLVVMTTHDMGKRSNSFHNGMPLIEALNDKRLRVGFRIFLESELSVENLDFWLAAEDCKKLVDPEARREKTAQIYEEYISPGAPNQINLDHLNRKQIMLQMASDGAPCSSVFSGAQRYIFNIMENDSYARFLSSKYYDICNSPGRRSPRRFFYDILHGGKSRERSHSPKKSSNHSSNNNNNNNNNNNKKLQKIDSSISFTPGCYCIPYGRR